MNLEQTPQNHKGRQQLEIASSLIIDQNFIEKINILPENRQKIFVQLFSCFENLMEQKGSEEDKEFIRHIFTTIGDKGLEILESVINDLEKEGRIELLMTKQKLQGVLKDLYLLLLTSMSSDKLTEEVKNEIMKVSVKDFERIVKIWEENEEGIRFSYGVSEEFGQPQMLDAENIVEESGRREIKIETDKGFLYVFQPNIEFWQSIFESMMDKEISELEKDLIQVILKVRELSRILSIINFPEQISKVILAKDEKNRNKELAKLSDEDKSIAKTLLNLRENFLKILQEVEGIRNKYKKFPPEQIQKVSEDIKKLKDKLDTYNRTIESLESQFGKKDKPNVAFYRGFISNIGEYLKQGFLTVGGMLGAWGLALGWFLPLWMITKMDEAISKRWG